MSFREPRGGLFVVTIDDEVWIPEENVESIFQRFYSERPTGHFASIGLGLSICRQIMETYGGSIPPATPRRGRPRAGARFTIRIQRPTANSAQGAMFVHATSVAIKAGRRWRAVLLRGPSGAGKSDLALRLIEDGSA